MWFIFPLIPAALVGIASVTGLAGGGKMLVTVLVADRWHRRRGHKNGEGVCTPLDGGWPGTVVRLDSESDLGLYLAALGRRFPSLMGRFQNRCFQLTKSEGVQVRAMLMPVQELLIRHHKISEKVAELREIGSKVVDDREGEEEFLESLNLVEMALAPVVVYLDSIPKRRVKVIADKKEG